MPGRRFDSILRRFLRRHRAVLTSTHVRGIVGSIMSTRPDELSCDECGEQLERFAELTLAGKNAADAIPLVRNHLDRCTDCREEFEALLVALQSDV